MHGINIGWEYYCTQYLALGTQPGRLPPPLPLPHGAFRAGEGGPPDGHEAEGGPAGGGPLRGGPPLPPGGHEGRGEGARPTLAEAGGQGWISTGQWEGGPTTVNDNKKMQNIPCFKRHKKSLNSFTLWEFFLFRERLVLLPGKQNFVPP